MSQTNNAVTIIKNLEIGAHDDSALKDFEKARADIAQVIETAKDSITTLAEVAEQSQHPRAYEVLAKLIDTTVSASKSLLDLQEKIRTIEGIESPRNEKAKSVTNNNLFVGSTAELQKLLKEMRENGDK